MINILHLGNFNNVTLNTSKQMIWRFQSIKQWHSLHSNN